MKRLIIAEKPSVARDIARNVGATDKRNGYIAGEDFDVTWCIGHLVGLLMPNDYGWESWQWETMPMLPKPHKLQASERTKDQFAIVSKLLNQSYV